MEKGVRGELKGLKPHSKGEDFSWSSFLFFERIVAASRTIDETKKVIIDEIIKLIITYS